MANLLNAILVNEGVRPSCLINNPGWKNKILIAENIKEIFPDLFYTPITMINGSQEGKSSILITKFPVEKTLYTDEEIGEMLGYLY